ncbi:MAG: hypothetical protein ACRCYC_05810 [Paraclostridium sp.]|uniref:hypothetical protein n=1 Tax=Paraclostridium sp. TaxID=2023273 RepID=UPI003F333277
MNKLTLRFIAITMCMSLFLAITPKTIYSLNSNCIYAPNPSQISNDLKGKEDLIKYFDDIKRIRNNINTISINAQTAKDKYPSIEKQINGYSAELKSILNSISKHKIVYKDSIADIFIANQLEMIAFVLDASLQQQLLFLKTVTAGDSDSIDLFFSEYLVSIYYYITVADEMIHYMETIYNIK